MAQILIVTKKLEPTVWQLAQSLSVQHEVRVLTSRHEKALTSSYRFEILTYFQNWSFLEFLRFLPHLLSHPPQIYHLMSDGDNLSAAELSIAGWSRSQFQSILSTSLLWDLQSKPLNRRTRFLIEESKVLTAATMQQFTALRGINVRQSRQGRTVLPPAISWQHPDELSLANSAEGPKELPPIKKPYLVIPWVEQTFHENCRILLLLKEWMPKHSLVFWQIQKEMPRRERRLLENYLFESKTEWHFLGSQSEEVSSLIAEAEALYLAGVYLPPYDLTNCYSKALSVNTPIILDSNQSPLHGDFWKHQENCWILDSDLLAGENRKLAARGKVTLSPQWNESVWKQITDQSFNELSRLYTQALEYKNA